jgi:hypothetical protein
VKEKMRRIRDDDTDKVREGRRGGGKDDMKHKKI